MTATFGPYSPVRQAGNLLFISGQVGVEAATKTASRDVAAQTKQALENLVALLAEHDASLRQVVKTTVFLADMSDFAAVNDVYQQYFAAPRPARSAVAVRELPRVAGDTRILVEIEAVVCVEAA
jgi:2-iminobutanoate/2-iminopropanoate deaminase